MVTLETIAGWIRDAGSVVVLTGAGISTDSGIPDFRGPQGVWTKDPAAEKRATLQHYMSNRDARVQSWKGRLAGAFDGAQPNAGHVALAELERKGKVDLLVTQNVDGLHLKAGTSLSRLVEVHGNVREFRCMNCTDRGDIQRVLARVSAGEEDPPCRSCGGILKTATISFGQNLEPGDMQRGELAASQCDVFIAIGTTLAVYPVAYLPDTALRNGAKLVIINAQETPYDPVADAILREPIGIVLPELVTLV
ncbi:NAD-dependent deacetylase [bacterium SCGC AG-212-C10]|nr:NAD-dependent deacetylase [bacterium SCGC AG-212-C10]